MTCPDSFLKVVYTAVLPRAVSSTSNFSKSLSRFRSESPTLHDEPRSGSLARRTGDNNDPYESDVIPSDLSFAGEFLCYRTMCEGLEDVDLR